MQIGFIGLGVMGKPMAMHLLTAGHALFSCANVSEISAELIGRGLHVCDSPAEVAKQTEIIITMLPDTPNVEQVLLGEQGVLAAIEPGKVIIDMSSISPSETQRFAYLANEAGCEYLDAPVSGGQAGAEAGTLSIMVGGNAQTFEQMRPLFELLGQNINLVGDIGSGQICKIANQIIVALNIEAVAEALVFASRAGADPGKVKNALLGGFASSKVLAHHADKMIGRQFEAGFRIDLHRKDLALALSSAQKLGVSLPNTATTQQLFNSCASQHDGGNKDHSSLIEALERLANHKIA